MFSDFKTLENTNRMASMWKKNVNFEITVKEEKFNLINPLAHFLSLTFIFHPIKIKYHVWI